MSDREGTLDRKHGLIGVRALLDIAGVLIIVGALAEVTVVSVVGVLTFVTVAGVVVVGDVLAEEAESSTSEAGPVVASEPTEVAGIVIAAGGLVVITAALGVRVLAVLAALALLAVGGVFVLSWLLGR